jgi:hypothetical protein
MCEEPKLELGPCEDPQPSLRRFSSARKSRRMGKRRNLGTFRTRAAAQRHERAGISRRVQRTPIGNVKG